MLFCQCHLERSRAPSDNFAHCISVLILTTSSVARSTPPGYGPPPHHHLAEKDFSRADDCEWSLFLHSTFKFRAFLHLYGNEKYSQAINLFSQMTTTLPPFPVSVETANPASSATGAAFYLVMNPAQSSAYPLQCRFARVLVDIPG